MCLQAAPIVHIQLNQQCVVSQAFKEHMRDFFPPSETPIWMQFHTRVSVLISKNVNSPSILRCVLEIWNSRKREYYIELSGETTAPIMFTLSTREHECTQRWYSLANGDPKAVVQQQVSTLIFLFAFFRPHWLCTKLPEGSLYVSTKSCRRNCKYWPRVCTINA